MIRFACPKCKKVLQVGDERAREEASCPACQARMRVPDAPRPAADLGNLDDEEREWRPRLDGDDGAEADAGGDAGRWPPEVRELGPVRQVHEGSRWAKILAFVAGAFLCLFSTFCMSSFLLALLNPRAPAVNAPGRPAPGMAGQPAPAVSPPLVGFLILSVPLLTALAGGAALIFLGTRLRPRTIVVCRDGLAVVSGRSANVCRWDAAVGVWQNVVRTRIYNQWGMHLRTRVDYRYTLEREDGERLIFTNRSAGRIEQLGNTIQREVTRRLLPLAFKAVTEERRVISFGPFGVGFDGLHFEGERMRWDDVRSLSLHSGSVRIGGRDDYTGDWAVVPVPRIANLHVFLNIVENLSGRRWL